MVSLVRLDMRTLGLFCAVLIVCIMCRTVYFLFFFNSMVGFEKGIKHQNFQYVGLLLPPIKTVKWCVTPAVVHLDSHSLTQTHTHNSEKEMAEWAECSLDYSKFIMAVNVHNFTFFLSLCVSLSYYYKASEILMFLRKYDRLEEKKKKKNGIICHLSGGYIQVDS